MEDLIMKRFYILFSLVILTAFNIKAQILITNTNTYYTAGQMLLANEINESGEPFAEALGYNLDNLDPFVSNSPDSIAYAMGIESYEYSRYALGIIVSRSGMGLHMMWAPMIQQMAMMEPGGFDGSMTGTPNGFKNDDELIKNIMHFGAITNHTPPMHPWPQFAEFESGDPHLPQAIDATNFTTDFQTLRWDRSKMNKVLNLAAMGQTMMKQYLWASDMLSAFHDSLDNGIDPDGIVSPDSAGSSHFDPSNNVFFGGDGLDGFIGNVLTAESINKTLFVINKLAYNGDSLGTINPATYDPSTGIRFFPHAIAVTEIMVDSTMPPMPSAFSVTDASSNLWDQVSYLWGALNFMNMMNPVDSSDAAHLAYKDVFDGDPFPNAMSQTGMPGPFDLMMGTSKVIFQNLMAMHYDMTSGSFVDVSGLDASKNPTPGNVITTQNAGYLLITFKQLANQFANTPLGPMALGALNTQAAYLAGTLQDVNGGFYNSYTIGTGPDGNAKTALAQAAAARGLYAAYEATNNSAYLTAADAAYNYLITNFWVPAQHCFRSEENNSQAVFSPEFVAIITGALREGNLVGGHADAPLIYTRFFKKVANAMQVSEGAPTGEAGLDSDGDGIPFIPEQVDGLPPMFATEATLDLSTGIGSVQTSIEASDLYPNPAVDIISLQLSAENAGNYSISILDNKGALANTVSNIYLNGSQQTINLNISQLPAGMYLVKVNGENGQAIRKFVKMK